MWRAFFLAIGCYAVILGVQCLGVEKVVLRSRPALVRRSLAGPDSTGLEPGRGIVLPRWAPFGVMGSGAMVVIYCFTVPRRVRGG